MKTFKQAIASKTGGRWREEWRTGIVGEARENYRYYGPTVDVSYNGSFVTVETDPYEGSAMFCIENLPDVIAILTEVSAQLRRNKVAKTILAENT